MKRWVSWVLALAMVTMTLLPASAEAVPQSATPETAVTQETQTEDDQKAITGTYGVLSYTVNDDGTSCSITDCDTSAKGELEIPEKIDGYKVTIIGVDAFYGCNALTSVTIPEGVTSIGKCAFWSCGNLTSINIPQGVTSIGEYAFWSCESLTSITIPEGVTSIGENAFEDCNSLTSITIPQSVTSIEKGVFWKCSSLTSITIPESVTSIGSYAFNECWRLTSITIPESVTSIDDHAFLDCWRLTSIVIPKGVTSIAGGTFENCGSLTSVVIPDSVTRIGEEAFSKCSSLTSMTIPESVTRIDSGAFKNCKSLISITIPDSVTSIGWGTFRDCSSLTSITIPGSVTSIGGYAFSGCNQLKDVYYGGTQEEKDAISVDNDNDPLLNATWHCKPTGPEVLPDVEVSKTARVHYFNSWDAEKKIAYWDNNVDGIGSAVTEETDLSFLDQVDSLVGHYVLADTKARTDGKLDSDTLLSIRPVDTKYGEVSAVSEKTITIDGTTYPFGQNIDTSGFLPAAENDSVVYYLCGNTLVGLEILQEQKATLTYWNADSRALTFSQDSGTTKTTVEAALSDMATEETLEFLGATGYTDALVYYKADKMNFVYEVRKRNADGGYGVIFDPDSKEAKEADARQPLRDYEQEWENAYQEFVKAVEEALKKPAEAEQTKEETIESEAKRMQEHDKTAASKYLTFNGGFKESYKAACYHALATLFYEHTSQKTDLGSIKTDGTMAGVQLVKSVMGAMYDTSETYTEGSLKIYLKVNGFGNAKFGSLTCTDQWGKSYGAVVTTTQQECQDTVNAYMMDLKDLSQNANYAFATSFTKGILKQSLSKLTDQYLNDQAKKLADKFEGKLKRTLEEQLKISDVDGLFDVLDDCYTYYTWGSKIYKLKDAEFPEALDQIINLKFEKTTIKDAAVKKAVKELKNKAKKVATALDKYMKGELIEPEKSVLKAMFTCPVDVAVFDANGTQIGFVSEDDIWYDDTIEITEKGGSKQIIALTDADFTLKVTGTDYGMMNCALEEYDSDGNIKGRLNYYDISVEPQQEYELTLVDDFKNNASAMPIKTGDQEIAASEYIDVTQDAGVVIKGSPESEDGTEGGTISGVGTYVKGDAVVLTAYPNEGYAFTYWSQGDDIVGTTPTYEFMAKEDVNLTAHFYRDDYVYVNVDTEEGGTVVGNTRYHAGDTATVIAEADEGSTFAGWYNGETCVSEEETYEFVVNEDTDLTAHWNVPVVTPTATPTATPTTTPTATPTATPSSTPASTMKPAHSLILDWIKQWFHPSPKPTPTPTALPTPTSAPTEEPKPTVEPSSTPSATVKPMKPNHHWWWFWPFW